MLNDNNGHVWCGPVSDDAEEVDEGIIEAMGSWYRQCNNSGSLSVADAYRTATRAHIPVATMDSRYRGTATNHGTKTWKLIETE